MASPSDTFNDTQKQAAEYLFKLLREEASSNSPPPSQASQSDFEEIINKLRLAIEGGTAARGGTDSPELTASLREQLFEFTQGLREFFGSLKVAPLPPPDPSAAQAQAAQKQQQQAANTSTVPAFDRPQAVIIMGPRPLPVSIVGGGGGAAPDAGPEKGGKAGGFDFRAAAQGIHLLTSGVSALSHSLRTAAVTTDALIDVTHAYVGALSKIENAVESFDPGTAYLFSQAAQNLEAALGRLLVPALKQATAILDLVNRAFTKLGPESKTMISALAGAGAIMVTLGVAVAATTAMLFAMAGALAVVDTAISIGTAGLSAVLGAIGAAFGAVSIGAVSAGAGLATFTALTSDTQKILAALTPILNALIRSLERLSPRFLELAEQVAPVIVQVVEVVATLAEMAVAIVSVKGALEVLAIAMAAAMIPILMMLAPFILLAAAAAAATVAIYTLLRALGMIEEIKLGGKGNKTIAATPATFSSAQSMAEKTYASAYSLGTQEENPLIASNSNLLGGITGLSGRIEKLTVEVNKWILAVTSFIEGMKRGADSLNPFSSSGPSNGFRDFAAGAIGNVMLPGGVGGFLGRRIGSGLGG